MREKYLVPTRKRRVLYETNSTVSQRCNDSIYLSPSLYVYMYYVYVSKCAI